MVLEAAMQAQDAGDYGIAAALLIRDRNTELISFGRNSVLSSRDPLGHAEINAIRGIQSMLAAQRAGGLLQVPPWTAEMPAGSAGSAIFSRPGSARRCASRCRVGAVHKPGTVPDVHGGHHQFAHRESGRGGTGPARGLPGAGAVCHALARLVGTRLAATTRCPLRVF